MWDDLLSKLLWKTYWVILVMWLYVYVLGKFWIVQSVDEGGDE